MSNKIIVTDPSTNETSLGTEEIVSQFSVDFNKLSGASMKMSFNSLDYSSSGSGTVNLRVGGTIVLTTAIADTNYSPISVVQTTTRPSGVRAVTVGLTSSGAGAVAGLNNSSIVFSSVQG